MLEAAEPAIDSPDRALEYLGQQSEVLHWGLNRPGELRELLDRAESWWPEKHWRQRLDPLRMQVAAFERPGLSLAETTRLLSDDGLAPKVRRQLEPAHIANLFFSGRTREALKRALSIRPELPLRSHRQALALSLWMRVSLETGEQWPELDQWMTGALDDAVRLGDRAGAGNAAYTLACLDFSAGRYREAATLLAEAELHLEYHDPTGVMPVVNAMQVGVACFSADPAAVGAALERLRARMNAIGTLAHHLAYVVRAEAWAAFATGDPPQAQRLLLDAAAEMTAGPVHAARLTYEAMRAGAPARRTTDALTPLAAACDARLVAAYAAHAAACAADDGPALLQVTGELEQIGALRYATEAAADAADAFARDGRQDSARRAAARARELHARGSGGVLPAMNELDGPAIALSRRDAQIARLAAQGLTNAEMAQRLVLSVRTVESHLYRAMQKLGVNDRRELSRY